MTINEKLLHVLACPETHQQVKVAPEQLVVKLNKQIEAKTLKNRSNHTVSEPCDGGLLREDQKVFYPIRQGIPVMLIEEAIDL